MHLPQLDLEHLKGALHMAIFFIALFKVRVIDKQLSMLEKRLTNK